MQRTPEELATHDTDAVRRALDPRSRITVSRLDDGRIIEDWRVTDTFELVRQLGLWRSLLLAARHRKLLRGPSGR